MNYKLYVIHLYKYFKEYSNITGLTNMIWFQECVLRIQSPNIYNI